MNILRKYIPFHFLLGLILGILLQFYTNLWMINDTSIIICNLILIGLLFFLHHKKLKLAFQINCFLCYVFIGIQSLYLNDSRNNENHYTKEKQANSTIVLEIKNELKSTLNNLKFVATVKQANQKHTVGNILLNITKDSISEKLKVGSQILAIGEFNPIQKPKNPYGFNYADYLSKKGINHQMYLKIVEYETPKTNSSSAYSIAQNIRNSIQEKLKTKHFSKETFAIINAMLLGDRDFISKELRNNYTKTGVIHILAISGLHIGILAFFLMSILKFIEKYKYGKVIKSILIVTILWCFALISGLSASVVRAVTMFSFVILANIIKRKTYIEFSLISSMLFILLIKPLFIFDVGFQMSYLAVFGIIWIRPLFMKVWNPKNKIILFFWNIATVSISAQIAVLPISLFYFHQITGLFLLTNMVVIPCITYILGFGILIIISALLNIEISILYSSYDFVIQQLNKWISFVSNFDDFIYKNIYISLTEMLFYYVLIILIYKCFTDFKGQFVILLLISITSIQSIYIYQKWYINTNQELIIFNQSKHTVIGKNNGTKLKLYSDTKISNFIENYKTKRKIKRIKKNIVPDLISFNNEIVLIIDSIGVYNINTLKEPIVLLRKSPKINLERLIQTLKPKQIIADASNYKTYTKRWKETCIKHNIPFHSTYEMGYWRFYIKK